MSEAGQLSGKRTRKKLGEMLVDAGYLTDERLAGYVAAQKRSGLKLGQFLIREGVVSESMIVDLVSRQAGIRRFDPAEFPVTMELAASLAETVSRKYGAGASTCCWWP